MEQNGESRNKPSHQQFRREITVFSTDGPKPTGQPQLKERSWSPSHIMQKSQSKYTNNATVIATTTALSRNNLPHYQIQAIR